MNDLKKQHWGGTKVEGSFEVRQAQTGILTQEKAAKRFFQKDIHVQKGNATNDFRYCIYICIFRLLQERH
jgi:hypothetical protein